MMKSHFIICNHRKKLYSTYMYGTGMVWYGIPLGSIPLPVSSPPPFVRVPYRNTANAPRKPRLYKGQH